MSEPMTKGEISSALPPTFRGTVTSAILYEVNSIIDTPDLADSYKDQFLWFGNILEDSRFTLESYVKAVRYVSLKALRHTNVSAWAITFPDRFKKLKLAGKSNRDIHSHVSGYHRTALVSKLLGQAMVPAWLVNQSNFQKAVNRQIYLMENAKSETVQTNAANSVMTHCGKPDVAEIAISTDIKVSTGESAIDAYKLAAKALAEEQLKALSNGVTLKDIAESVIETKGTEDESDDL